MFLLGRVSTRPLLLPTWPGRLSAEEHETMMRYHALYNFGKVPVTTAIEATSLRDLELGFAPIEQSDFKLMAVNLTDELRRRYSEIHNVNLPDSEKWVYLAYIKADRPIANFVFANGG